MIKTHRAILGLILSSAAATAQTPQAAYRGQSWVGLLVSDSCKSREGTARQEADLTMNGRTTTPAVDDSGTRGSSDRDAATPTQKQTLPATGDVLTKGKPPIDPGWGAARKQAQSLGASCTVDANTMRFGLLLPDGTLLRFDQLANQSIAKQLPSLPMGTKQRRVLRVSVQGKMQNNQIALDSIQM